jgi:hypothetical protein
MLWTVAVRRRPIFLPGWNLHTSQEIGIDDFQEKRSPDNRYRTEQGKIGSWGDETLHVSTEPKSE